MKLEFLFFEFSGHYFVGNVVEPSTLQYEFSWDYSLFHNELLIKVQVSSTYIYSFVYKNISAKSQKKDTCTFKTPFFTCNNLKQNVICLGL